ncbi:MAG: aldo/keto reductase [Eubacteriales bacterium]
MDRFGDDVAGADGRKNRIRALNEIAAGRGQTLSQLALSWVLRGNVTSVLIGASSPEQIVQNLGILNSPAFTPEVLERIDAISTAKP